MPMPPIVDNIGVLDHEYLIKTAKKALAHTQGEYFNEESGRCACGIYYDNITILTIVSELIIKQFVKEKKSVSLCKLDNRSLTQDNLSLHFFWLINDFFRVITVHTSTTTTIFVLHYVVRCTTSDHRTIFFQRGDPANCESTSSLLFLFSLSLFFFLNLPKK